ncbi:FAS1 domain-containing protein [Glonium stellatum]|uniref:FAS1 domain-containing protein n=1 Tax=Glonium stellatum TaxID=574774 RepID=A0A8E2F1K4_9PEZI|nr:FAS1 domain-containing protein [Glonium stellatum]
MHLLFIPLLYLPLLSFFSPACLVRGQFPSLGPIPTQTTTANTPTSSLPSLSDVCKTYGVALFCDHIDNGIVPALGFSSASGTSSSSSIGGGSGSSSSSITTSAPTDVAAPPGSPKALHLRMAGESLPSSITLFAPADAATPSISQKALHLLMARQSIISQPYLYQIAPYLIDAATMRGFTGCIVQTLDNYSVDLDGRPQVVLSHGQRDSINASQSSCSGTPSPIHIFSGIGNVTIAKEDIYFEGGIMHITDNYFTLPNTLSESLSTTAETKTFASYLTSNSSLDSAPEITVFAPNNAAFLTALGSNQSISATSISSLVDAHIVEGSVAYSPFLVSGMLLQTTAGADVLITATPDGRIFVNDAQIVTQDIITENGVVHIIDKSSCSIPRAPQPPLRLHPSLLLHSLVLRAGPRLTRRGQIGWER